MPKAFVFRCPVTRLNVQAFIDTDIGAANDYIPPHCNACGGFHLVIPSTGKLLREEAEIVNEGG